MCVWVFLPLQVQRTWRKKHSILDKVWVTYQKWQLQALHLYTRSTELDVCFSRGKDNIDNLFHRFKKIELQILKLLVFPAIIKFQGNTQGKSRTNSFLRVCLFAFPSEHLHGYIAAPASSMSPLHMATHGETAHSSKPNCKSHPSLAIYLIPCNMIVWIISLVKPTSFYSSDKISS